MSATSIPIHAAGARSRGRLGSRSRPRPGTAPPQDQEPASGPTPPGGFRRRASDRIEAEELDDDLDRARQLAEIHGLPLVDLAVTGRLARGDEARPARGARAGRRDPVLGRREHAPDRAHRPGQRPRHRRAPAHLAAAGRVRGRAARGRDGRGPAAEPRERRVRRRPRRRAPTRQSTTSPDDLEADDGISEGPIVRLVNSIIFQAAEDGASDVHFEPQEDALLVRFRVDGVLVVAQRIPRQLATGVVTRLKVLAKLDIAERRKPQDGRMTLGAGAAGRLLDIRVATLPTVYGESIVMRLLDKSRKAPTLAELGLSDAMHDRLAEVVKRPTGALLVTGPDRLRQVDDALRRPRRDQPPRDQRDHGRGSGRVPARRDQPGADQHAGRASPSRPCCARSSAPTPT